jgi:hypothetical protein
MMKWPGFHHIRARLKGGHKSRRRSTMTKTHPAQSDEAETLSRPMAELFVSLWRAHARAEQGGDAERALFMIQRHLDAAMQRMAELGVELKTYQGERYDPGMRSVAPTHFQVSDEVSHEMVGEVTSPAIFVRGQISSKAQAVILVPPVKTAEGATEPSDKAEATKPAKRKPKRTKQQPQRGTK